MLFQLSSSAANTDAIARAMKAHDAFAQVSFDAGTNQVKVPGQLSVKQALAAFKQADTEASEVLDAKDVHVSGGSTCCGSCT